MAFDGIVLNKVVNELQSLKNGKVNRIYEPNKNELIISVYANGKTYALNIDISADNYRLNLTTNEKPNPFVAPNFCMLLRKYLINSKINKISARFFVLSTRELYKKEQLGKILNYSYLEAEILLDVILNKNLLIKKLHLAAEEICKKFDNIAFFEQ